MTTTNEQTEIIRLRGLGNSFDKIAARLGISKPTVIKVCRAYEDEIAAIHTKEVETVIEEVAYTVEARSDMYKQLVQRLYKEIVSRDLSEVSTDRLFSMLERTERSLTAIEARNNPPANTSTLLENMSDEDLAAIATVGQSVFLPKVT